MPFYILILTLPQFFQIVNQQSPGHAALRLLPFLLPLPVVTLTATTLTMRLKIPVLIPIFIGSCLFLVSLSVMSTASKDFTGLQYAMEVFAGIGAGPTIGLSLSYAIQVVRRKEPRGLCTSSISYRYGLFPLDIMFYF
jgi:hypothetical protein